MLFRVQAELTLQSVGIKHVGIKHLWIAQPSALLLFAWLLQHLQIPSLKYTNFIYSNTLHKSFPLVYTCAVRCRLFRGVIFRTSELRNTVATRTMSAYFMFNFPLVCLLLFYVLVCCVASNQHSQLQLSAAGSKSKRGLCHCFIDLSRATQLTCQYC